MTASPAPTPADDDAAARAPGQDVAASAPGHDAAALVRRAGRLGATVGTAESLTGGAVASAIVAVPGASACFEGAVVSYSHAVKERVLGVPHDLLAERGAVDPDVALAMARGARAALGVDWAVSTTGVAGPEPHDGHEVGTVFIGVSGPGHEHVERLQLDGDRARIRELTVHRALDTLTTQMPFPGDA